MSMYEMFRQDTKAEQEGIVLDYGTFRIKAARMGGSNKSYRKAFEARMRPYQRASDLDLLTDDIKEKVLRESVADAVILEWHVRNAETGTWDPGIEGEDGTVLPFKWDNVVATFIKLPELLSDVIKQCGDATLYRAKLREEAAKNSLGAYSTS